MKILRPSAAAPRFYAYRDDVTNSYYFHNPITNECSWALPSGCDILFPDLKRFTPDGSFLHSASFTNILQPPAPESPKIFDRRIRAQSVRVRRARVSPSGTLGELAQYRAEKESPQLPLYFPISIRTDQNLVNLAFFVKGSFRALKKSSKKKEVDDPFQADDSSSKIPLLKSVDHKYAKAAVKLFSYIVAYGGNEGRPLSAFVDQLAAAPALVDEAYMQTIRQTRGNPNQAAVAKMWVLILVLCTLFCASVVVQPAIRQILATAACSKDGALTDIAQLAYLRFDGRCHIGTHARAPSGVFIEAIPSHVTVCHFTLGASLFELMWQQRKTLPRCPVPIFMHKICSALVSKGALEKVEVLKSAGNPATVERLCADIDAGKAVLEAADLAVLVTVFKRWLGMLPQPIVPLDVYPRLLEQTTPEDYVFLAGELPRISRNALAYLVGFFKRFVEGGRNTRAGIGQVVETLALTVIRQGCGNQSKAKDLSDMSKRFAQALIQVWDVSEIYPLPAKLCQ
jgi:hypothetical protein